MQSFQSLRVWHDAHRLNLDVYRATRTFPVDERFGLTAQLRRSSSSVADNLAEGTGRPSAADFNRFVAVALGSCEETAYHLLLAHDLNLLSNEQYQAMHELAGQVGRQLLALHKRLAAAKFSSS